MLFSVEMTDPNVSFSIHAPSRSQLLNSYKKRTTPVVDDASSHEASRRLEWLGMIPLTDCFQVYTKKMKWWILQTTFTQDLRKQWLLRSCLSYLWYCAFQQWYGICRIATGELLSWSPLSCMVIVSIFSMPSSGLLMMSTPGGTVLCYVISKSNSALPLKSVCPELYCAYFGTSP